MNRDQGSPVAQPPVRGGSAPLLSRNQLRFHERQARARDGLNHALPIVLLVLGAVCYNGLLAFLNAHGLFVGRSLVVLTELMILAGVALTLVASGTRVTDGIAMLFLAFFLCDALAVSLLNERVYVDMGRNAAIVALFLMLGARTNLPTLNRCFLLVSGVVAAILLLEIFSVESYASAFAPASYFQQTRGIAPSEFDDLGLFGNALGFDDRFSILQLIDHRASSIFLEQVSLANFAIVLSIYLASRWKQVPTGQRIFSIALIALILVTTNSRAALGLTFAAPVVYFLAPKISRFSSLAIMPAALGVATVIAASSAPSGADDLQGRVGLTIRNLGSIDLTTLLGGNVLRTQNFADSGYAFVIAASSILGLLALWLFVSLVAAGRSHALQRCNLLLGLYVFLNLTVSGTSVFSIKTAALLWLLVGHLRHSESASASSPAPAGFAAPERQPRAAPSSAPAHAVAQRR